MSNSYGFDFLKTEHRLDEEGEPLESSSAADLPSSLPHNNNDLINNHDDTDEDAETAMARRLEAAQHKPDIEKQFDIIGFLQNHRDSGCLAASVIYRATGIDLDVNPRVAASLRNNPKVRIEMIPDPENPSVYIETFAFRANYPNIRDKSSLLAQINRMMNGVPSKTLNDSYPSVADDIQALITAGDIIAISNSEGKDKILFPRGDDFLVELDGLISLPQQAPVASNGIGKGPDDATSMPPPLNRHPEMYMVETDVDPRSQIRRGEAVEVGGQWFRVSSAIKEGPLSEQPARAQAPLSVVSRADLSRENEKSGYIRQFTVKLLPLDGALSSDAQQNVLAAKAAREKLSKLAHGRSGGGTGQLLGSNAYAANPVTVAATVSGSAALAAMRNKRSFSKMASARSSPSNHAGGLGVAVDNEELKQAVSDPALALFCRARRHGCTRDVRDLYLATRDSVPKDDKELFNCLVEHKLLDAEESFRQQRLGKTGDENDSKPKKRRYYEKKNQRMTNTHLDGTDIGGVLARAAEDTRQGRAVGDGGM